MDFILHSIHSKIFHLLILFMLIISELSAQTPKELAENITHRIIQDTKFEFQQTPVKWEQERVAILNFEVLNQNLKTKQLFAYSKIIRKKKLHTDTNRPSQQKDKVILGLSADAGSIILYKNKNKIFDSKIIHSRAFVDRLDYELIHFSEYISIPIEHDTTELIVAYTPKNNFKKVYVSLLDTVHLMTSKNWAFDQWKIIKRDLSISPKMHFSDSDVDTFPTPIVHTLAKGNQNMADWRYYNGALLLAMDDIKNHFSMEKIDSFLQNHTSFFIKNLPKIKQERTKYGLIDSPFSLYFRGKLLDDWGMQIAAFAQTMLYVDPKSRDYTQRSKMISEGLFKIKKYVHTLADGTLTRATPENWTVQSDDLMMGGYAYLRLGLTLKKPEWIEEAARQSLLFHHYLFDSITGLYRHAYFTSSQRQSCCSWGRGMGWMMLVNTELLKHENSKMDSIQQNFILSCEALLKVQNKNGGFHQVLTDTSTYLETSATAMFLYAFAEGVSYGWLPKEKYEVAIEKGWSFVKSQILQDGSVKNIVRGTPILSSVEEYNDQKTNTNDPRGLGAILWLCKAMDRYYGIPR